MKQKASEKQYEHHACARRERKFPSQFFSRAWSSNHERGSENRGCMATDWPCSGCPLVGWSRLLHRSESRLFLVECSSIHPSIELTSPGAMGILVVHFPSVPLGLDSSHTHAQSPWRVCVGEATAGAKGEARENLILPRSLVHQGERQKVTDLARARWQSQQLSLSPSLVAQHFAQPPPLISSLVNLT